MKTSRRKKTVTEIFYSALRAVDPGEAVRRSAAMVRRRYETGPFRRCIVVGFGKASCPMAKALEDELADIVDAGWIVTKYGHCPKPHHPVRIAVCEAGHPVPDQEGVRGAAEIMRLLRNVDASTLVICLISGGGSALLVAPAPGVTLQEKQLLTDLLLKAGANITELNIVRKHLSQVKGGRLAELAQPATVISLLLSDVIGDKLDVIASGPTCHDPSTYGDALAVLDKYDITRTAPAAVVEALKQGAVGQSPETPKAGNPAFKDVENIIIGSLGVAIRAAKEKAEALGYETVVLTETLQGEAREAAAWLAKKAMEAKQRRAPGRPLCLLSGGETTVTVTGEGKGGRNTEFALAFAEAVAGQEGVTLLSAGTDGTDGPTDAAGAIVNGRTITNAVKAGIDSRQALAENDSYTFFKRTGELLITGPTGTNVMDIQIVLMDS